MFKLDGTSVITATPTVTDDLDAARSVLAEFRALRAHMIGPRPRDTLTTLRARSAAFKPLRDTCERLRGTDATDELDVAMGRLAAMRAFTSFAPPHRTAVDAIASAIARRKVIVSRMEALDSQFRSLWAELHEQWSSARDFDEREAVWNAISDLRELSGHTHFLGEFSYDHSAELRYSAISEEAARDAGVWTERWTPLMSRLLCGPVPENSFEWLVYPYFRPGREVPAGYRAKRSTVTGRGGGYRQPTGIRTGIYFPPRTRRCGDLRDPTRPLIWIEGEKKAICLDLMGYAVVGLPGVWTTRDKAFRKGVHHLHPWVREDVVVAGRVHIIFFDRDLCTNPQIRRAAQRLAMMLRAAGAADVRLVDWPHHAGPKGADDLRWAEGDAAVHDLIATAQSFVDAEIWVPASVMADVDLTSARKIVLATLCDRSDKKGCVKRSTVARLAGGASRSRQATGELIDWLVTQKRLKRYRGQATRKEDGSWMRSPNRYAIPNLAQLVTQIQYRVRPEDIAISDGVALALAVLRRHGAMRVALLATTMGIAPRTVRDILAVAGTWVQRSHGRVAVASSHPTEAAETRPSLGESVDI
jgi:hypothetical protein